MGRGPRWWRKKKEEFGCLGSEEAPALSLASQGLRHVVTINVCNRKEK